MYQQQAIDRAAKLAKRDNCLMYVVIDDGYESGPGPYHVADDYDLDTFFLGIDPIYCVEPDGTIN